MKIILSGEFCGGFLEHGNDMKFEYRNVVLVVKALIKHVFAEASINKNSSQNSPQNSPLEDFISKNLKFNYDLFHFIPSPLLDLKFKNRERKYN